MIEMFAFMILLSSGPAWASTPTVATEPADFCQPLLVVTPDGLSALPPAAVREMASRFGRGSRAAAMNFADSLRVVVDQLIAEGTISPAQAEHVFASRVLGQYAPIFLRFAIAELKARTFDEERIVDFFIHFENAFSAEEQIDFAVAVARRMLVTVNDAASWWSVKGFDRYLDMMNVFGVSSNTYADFLETWRYVRTAYPQTVVHFILANVRNAGLYVTSEAQRRLDAQQALPPPETRSAWSAFFGATPPPRPPQLDLRSSARAEIDLEVPEFIQNVEGLIVDDTPADPRLERLIGRRIVGPPETFAEKLELFAPVARNFLVENHFGQSSYAQLKALRRSPVFGKLAEPLRARIEAELQVFAEMSRLAVEVQRQHEKVQREASKNGRMKRNKLIEVLYSTFQASFSGNKNSNSRSGAEELSKNIMEVFSQASIHHGDLSAAEFVALARRIITLVFMSKRGLLAVATAQTLASLSRDYELSDSDVSGLIGLIDSLPLKEPEYDGERPLRRFDQKPSALLAENWGRQGPEEEVVTGDDVTPKLAEALGNFRRLLPPEESRDLDDDELLEKIMTFQPIKNTKTKGF